MHYKYNTIQDRFFVFVVLLVVLAEFAFPQITHAAQKQRTPLLIAQAWAQNQVRAYASSFAPDRSQEEAIQDHLLWRDGPEQVFQSPFVSAGVRRSGLPDTFLPCRSLHCL